MRLGRKLKSRHMWTIRELNELRSMAPDVTLKIAADHFNVPKFAVKNACNKYGIKVGIKQNYVNTEIKKVSDLKKAMSEVKEKNKEIRESFKVDKDTLAFRAVKTGAKLG